MKATQWNSKLNCIFQMMLHIINSSSTEKLVLRKHA